MDNLEEFEEPEFKYHLTGVLKKNIAGFCDAIIVLIIADLLGNFVMPYHFFVTNFSPGKIGLFYLGVFILYRMVTILFLSGSFGMRLLRCQYMHEGNLKLTLTEKALAALMVYINGIRMYDLK